MPQIVAHNYEIGYSFTHVYLWYDDDDRNAAALLEKGQLFIFYYGYKALLIKR